MSKTNSIVLENWGSISEFRKAKRAELRDLEAAYNELRTGCAHLPPRSYHRACIIGDHIKALKAELSVKEWGR